MKIILLTTRNNQFASLFWNEYVQANGPKIDTTINLPDRSEIQFPLLAKPYVAYKLLGMLGIWQLITQKLSAKNRHASVQSIKRFTRVETDFPSLKQRDIQRHLEELSPDLLVSVGAPIIFKKDLLNIASLGAVNLHNGRVPRYRGHFATFWEVANESMSFVTIHEMLSKVDMGRVFTRRVLHLPSVEISTNC